LALTVPVDALLWLEDETGAMTRELNGAGDEDRTRITSLEGSPRAIWRPGTIHRSAGQVPFSVTADDRS
jgi:hypothetical protein